MSQNHLISVDNAAFSELLRTWNTHQDLRMSSAPLTQLVAAQVELDEARSRIRNAA
jgi:hypothetical protein